MPSIAEALALGQQSLGEISDSARLDTELLLCRALAKPRSYLHAWDEATLSPTQWQHYQSLLNQRAQGQPIAYILGEQEFWSLSLQVTPATLIPRPETELLVETVLALMPPGQRRSVIDLGTGSGAIALALAHERPELEILATDISEDALSVARVNAETHRLSNVRFLKSDWFAGLPEGLQVDVIVSNPPYVPAADPHLGRGDVRHEPADALQSGERGLDDLQRIIAGAPAFLAPAGWLLVEHGYDQGEAVRALFEQQQFDEIQQKQDIAGQTRVTLARRQAPGPGLI